MSIHSQDQKQGVDEKKMERFILKALKVLLGATLVALIGLAIWANM